MAEAPRDAPGASIVHLAVALVAMTILASLAIPRWFGRHDVTLDSAAVLLAQDLREVQNRAAFQRRALRVVFLPEGRGYEVQDAAGRVVQASLGDGPFRRVYDRDAVFRGVRVTAVECDGGERALSYDPSGVLSEGARLELGFRGHARTVTLEPGTGRATIEGLRRDWEDDGR